MSKTEIWLKIRILICDRKNQSYSQMKYSEIWSLTRRWDQMFQFFVHLIDDGLFSFNLSSHSGNITLPGINKLAQIFDMPFQNFKFFSSLPNFSFFLRNFLIILGDLIGLLRDLKILNKFCVMSSMLIERSRVRVPASPKYFSHLDCIGYEMDVAQC